MCLLLIFQNSSPFLLIVIHVCFPALVLPNTGRPKMWAVALVVQQPATTEQNLQTAIFTPPYNYPVKLHYLGPPDWTAGLDTVPAWLQAARFRAGAGGRAAGRRALCSGDGPDKANDDAVTRSRGDQPNRRVFGLSPRNSLGAGERIDSDDQPGPSWPPQPSGQLLSRDAGRCLSFVPREGRQPVSSERAMTAPRSWWPGTSSRKAGQVALMRKHMRLRMSLKHIRTSEAEP